MFPASIAHLCENENGEEIWTMPINGKAKISAKANQTTHIRTSVDENDRGNEIQSMD